jgi:hypothetical protein
MNVTEQSEIARYVEALRAELADLPAPVREELLEDLADHLAEVAAEGEGSLVERLGPPAAYAEELRATAGLTGTQRRRRVDAREAAARLRAVAARLDTRVGGALGYPRASDFARLLRPAWWVLRGYVAAMLLLQAVPGPFGLLPTANEYALIWLIVVALAVVASVRLGKGSGRWRGWPMALVVMANAVLMLVLLSGVWTFVENATYNNGSIVYVAERPEPPRRIYPYDRQGRPLRDVRLVDDYGQDVYLDGEYCPDGDRVYDGNKDAPPLYPACGRNHPFPMLSPLPEPTPTTAPTPTPTAAPTPPPTSPRVTPSPSRSG